MSRATELFQLDEDIKKSRELVQYVNKGTDNVAVGTVKLMNTLDPGYYKCSCRMDGIHFTEEGLRTDDLLRFKDSAMDEVIKEVDKFWGLKQDFNNMGFVHNRGVLLYGPPGTGKSCLIKLLVEQMIGRGEIVFTCGNRIDTLIEGLRAFREVEPSRKLLVVMEDIDAIIRRNEHSLLELLDGDTQVDNVLYIGTTNHINKIPERAKRPGRFDHLVEIGFPNDAGRKAYFDNKLGRFEKKETIDKLVKLTNGFSFGHLREFLISVYCLKKDKKQVLARLGGKDYSSLPDRHIYSDEKVCRDIKESYSGIKIKRILKVLNS